MSTRFPTTRVSRRAVLATLGVQSVAVALGGSCVTARDNRLAAKATVRVFLPASVSHTSRIDRARDLQLTRGEALRSGVTVEVLVAPPSPAGATQDDPDRLRAIATLRASGTGPDVIWVPLLDLPDLQAQVPLTPLGSLVARDRVDLKAYMPQAIQPAYAPSAGLLALPEEVVARQVYVRQDHIGDAGLDYRQTGFDFEKPQSTWETLRRLVLDLSGAPAARSRVAFDPSHDGLPMIAWAWQAGASPALNQPDDVGAVTHALEWLAALGRETGVPRGPKVIRWPPVARWGVSSAVPDTSSVAFDEAARHPLVRGTASIAVETTRFVSTLVGADDRMPVRVVEPWRRNDTASRIGWADVYGYCLASDATDDAWDLLKYLTSEDASYASARAVALRLPPWLDANPGSRAPSDLPGGPRRYFPPCSGRLALDRYASDQYRTGIKRFDEAHDHGMEQIRAVRSTSFALSMRGTILALEKARHEVVLDGRAPRAAASDAIATIPMQVLR